MLRKLGAFVILLGVSASTLSAATLPQIMAGPDNAVPQCVTPGRLMAYLRQRNPDLDARYDGIATLYMRLGEKLGVRWDYAFYQMIIETGSLSYRRGNRRGDVKPEQNNFAGLGATGNGVPGESFEDMETGVRAHLEHVLLYAGRPVDEPVAERTRKVREWGVLDDWQRSITQPITYADLATKWAPSNGTYVRMLRGVAGRFMDDLCETPDPRPELVAEARAGTRQASGTADGDAGQTAEAAAALTPGEKLAQRAIERSVAEGTDRRSSLGVQPAARTAALSVPYKVVDEASTKRAITTSAAAPAAAEAQATAAKAGAGDASSGSRFVVAGAAATAGAGAKGLKALIDPNAAVPPAANQKCRVWTASYGGQKSIIIRSVADDKVVNFTVLDVNAGSEAREAQAFIAAYAKDGVIAGKPYPSQAEALDKAFELCPEG